MFSLFYVFTVFLVLITLSSPIVQRLVLQAVLPAVVQRRAFNDAAIKTGRRSVPFVIHRECGRVVSHLPFSFLETVEFQAHTTHLHGD